MPANYTLIEKITVGSAGASSVTFNSIPQTGYTDLVLVASARSTVGDDWYTVNFNGTGVGTNMSGKYLFGQSTSGYAGSIAYLGTIEESAYTSNTFASNSHYIPNYTSANYKSISTDMAQESNTGTPLAGFLATLWSNTAAITSIGIASTSGSIAQYSTFYLYGVAKLGTTPAIVPYATGGDTIMTDGTYWYHAFKSSGTFTPAKGLSCDVLVVAGGGSGGGAYGNQSAGGGGAGGYQLFSSQSVATAQTITIGAGGAGVSSSTLSAGNSGSNSQFGSLTASVGGGRGGVYALGPAVGGSGGGAGNQANTTGAAGTSGQGFAGGNASNNPNEGAGGGGGAGAVGSPVSVGNGGNGGAGKNSESSWLSVVGLGVSGYLAGGGGGTRGANGSVNGTGGSGGGSNATSLANGTAATANTGGGGGGVYGDVPYYTGGNGGSGLVIVRYAV